MTHKKDNRHKAEPRKEAHAEHAAGEEKQQEDHAEEADAKTDEGCSSSAEKQLVGKLKEAEGKASEYLDHLQRLQAEFDNYRKREVKDRQMARIFAIEDVVASLIPVFDNFQRAMGAFKALENVPASLVQGIEMIYGHFLDVLKNYGVETIKTRGEKFNPAFHEAVGSEEAEDKDEHTILREVMTGYRLNDRVIRPATVIVSSKQKKEEKAGSKSSSSSDTNTAPAEE
jgi:molecular chaperone GrpE